MLARAHTYAYSEAAESSNEAWVLILLYVSHVQVLGHADYIFSSLKVIVIPCLDYCSAPPWHFAYLMLVSSLLPSDCYPVWNISKTWKVEFRVLSSLLNPSAQDMLMKPSIYASGELRPNLVSLFLATNTKWLVMFWLSQATWYNWLWNDSGALAAMPHPNHFFALL